VCSLCVHLLQSSEGRGHSVRIPISYGENVMPNGGSDCCGTCWFNSHNDGEVGYSHALQESENRCIIRDDLLIEDPFWTYCANHPHHNPDRTAIPVGPVYQCQEPPYTRYPWVTSIDNEEVRIGLLTLLEDLPEAPRHAEYPTETRFDSEVIRQLGGFREPRALPGLRRVLGFNPDARGQLHSGEKSEVILGNPGTHDRREVIGAAYEAIGHILCDEALPELEQGLRFGRRGWRRNKRDVIVRWGAARGLRSCSSEPARQLIERVYPDPDVELTEFLEQLRKSFRG